MYFLYHRDYRWVNKPLLFTLVFLLVLILFLTFSLTFAPTWVLGAEQQPASGKISSPPLTIDAMKERIEAVKQTPGLSEESKQRIIGFYEKAIASLARREKAIFQAAEYDQALKEAPKSRDPAETVLAPVRAAAIQQRARAMVLTDIEGQIAGLQAQLAQEQTTLEVAKKKLEDVVKRPAELRKTIAVYELELSDLEKRLAAPSPTDAAPRVIRARRTSLRARSRALQAELAAAEKGTTLSRRELTVAQDQQAFTARKVIRLENLIKTWEDVKEHRQSDAGFIELRQAHAILQKMNKEPWPKQARFLRKLANGNLTLSKTLIQLGQEETEAKKVAELLETRLRQIQKDFALTKRRTELMGLSKQAGQLLRSRRNTLLTSRADSGVARNRRDKILRINLAQDDLMQARQDFLVFRNKIYTQLDDLESSLTKNKNHLLTTQAFLMLESRRKLFEETGATYIKYLKLLNAQVTAQKKIDSLSGQYRGFINQRLLWAQSSNLVKSADIKATGKALGWLAGPSNWGKLARDFKLSVKQGPAVWGMLLIALVVLVVLRPRLDRRINRINEFAAQPQAATMAGTFAAMALTLLRTAGVLFIIYLGARELWHLQTAHNFTRAFCSGISSTAVAAIFLGLIIQISKLGGMGRTHFLWNEGTCNEFFRHAKALLYIFLPLLFFAIFIQNGPQGLDYRGSLGRLLFVLSMIPLGFVLARILSKTGPLAQSISEKNPEGRLNKYRRGWSTVIVAIPFVLMILAILGYYFTAYELGKQFGNTAWLFLILIVAETTMRRGLWLAQMKITIQKAESEREAAEKKAAESAQLSPEEDVQPLREIAEPSLDAEEINEQTLLVIRSVILVAALLGICLIWAETFPAFRFLDRVHLWEHQIGIDKTGKPTMGPVTLPNLIVSLLIFAGTIIAVRTIPGLLEVLILKRSKLDKGSRHAFGLISRYVVFIIGIFFALSAIGIGWKQFQWLAAAMTVGLSFGLKDIFANFVSGIIILFERPIRVGDSVIVGKVSGRVSRIRIRSTMITNWDKKEVIVPNMAFLSEKIINSTLSDRIIRVVIDVGIGYGSDTVRAQELLLQIAKDNSRVKEKPAPSVFFTAFGADSLDFKLRLYITTSDTIKVQNEIRHEINKTFNEAGIEIPFAQRDVHLDTSGGPLEVRMAKGEDS
ncbi:MAG: mechanosensitive ion channel [Deltaproteobacteria bacterium]|uniref:Mechanosensitive ion channel n=1 Tax=Candidatus Desulfacyla euxinica TaxID=2841693 RepID=A0A8J6T5C1_9DELT|nr:mechanosensitive ion channel [Candidatus Desulfacyla euxinica]MBL7218101.1 mechanosensitive ion channel [Desulfobacteraceae bacterium]